MRVAIVAYKIEKQAYQLAEWIVVSQLKTVLNDKFGAYFYLKKLFSQNFDLSESGGWLLRHGCVIAAMLWTSGGWLFANH
jgi:hypothetical protein